ncbi:hypothetical protein KQI61_12665 [Anaerocolumna aminovalerica]|jgi:hypothetical protein|uniref:hypothetical protein n=1 Tax=Anaerocolumna aminovalerica TaxID=1527 RepID=UPI001C0E8F61|nr:hypothetical protein [Anaerocolumna aminovalerica]MBU5333050.1 hypothetical protein [Anaerocolumna aminovalerica]
MKRKIVYILMIVLTMSVFTACKNTGKEDDNKGSNNNTEAENKENEDDKNGETKDSDNGNSQDTVDSELTSIIKKIYEIKDPELAVAETPVDLSDSDSVKYYTGLSDSSKLKEAVASETMIGSQAYSLVLVRLNDANDGESVAKEMLKGIDPRKWICVEADDLQVVGHDDVIMLSMVSSSFKDSVTSQQLVDAFKEVCGGKLDIELK